MHDTRSIKICSELPPSHPQPLILNNSYALIPLSLLTPSPYSSLSLFHQQSGPTLPLLTNPILHWLIKYLATVNITTCPLYFNPIAQLHWIKTMVVVVADVVADVVVDVVLVSVLDPAGAWETTGRQLKLWV